MDTAVYTIIEGDLAMMHKDDFDEYWDSMTHSTSEYREEIRSLRERIRIYLKELEELKIEKHAVTVDWIKAVDEIQTLRERIKALGGE